MDLSKIIDPSKFTSSTGLSGREQQVATFKLVELYLAALSDIIFTQSPVQEIASQQTTTVNSTSDQHRREIIQRELLFCEQIILPDRKKVEMNLLDSDKQEALLFKKEVDKIRRAGARFAQLDIPSANDSNINTSTEASDYHLYSLKSQLDILPSTSKPQDIITTAIPTLVAMGLTITDNLTVERFGHSKFIAAGAGAGIGGVGICVIRLLSGNMILAVVLGLFLSIAAGYSVYRSLLTVIDQEYFKMLELIAKSMGVAMHKTRQHPYWLEREISEIYWKRMASYSDTHICDNWQTTFFQHHDLAKIKDKQLQLNWLNKVKCVHAHFTLRQQMSKMLTIGVIGTGKAGKSMLIHKMFGFPTRSGATRTKKIKAYRVSDRFQMLDLPHLNSTYNHLKRSFAHSYTMMNGIIVLLNAEQQADDEHGEGHALSTVQQLAMEGVEILYCFNKSDILVRTFEQGDKSASTVLSDDEDDNTNHLSLTKQKTQIEKQPVAGNQATTESELDEFANRYEKYGVHRNQCKLTYFDLNEKEKTERNRIKKHLKTVGILNGADIRENWVRTFLKDNGLEKETIDPILQFRYQTD